MLLCVCVHSEHPVPTAVLTAMCVCVTMHTSADNSPHNSVCVCVCVTLHTSADNSTYCNMTDLCISSMCVMFTNADSIYSMTDR